MLSSQNRFVRSITAALAVGAGLAMTASTASAEIVLSYSPWFPPGYVINEPALYPWMEKVEDVTDGRVRVVPRAAAVGKAAQQYDTVRDGMVDISVAVLGYTAGRFPLMEIGELPLLHEDASVLSPALFRTYEKHFAQYEPFKGVHLLSVNATTPFHIATSTGIIETMEDLEGLKMRTPSSTTSDITKLVGGVPLQKAATEVYELLSSGVIDGTYVAPHSIVDFNTGDYLRYLTLVPGGMGQAVQLLIVNERKWESISERDRAAIMKISGEAYALAAGAAFADSEVGASETLRKDGVTIQKMNPKVAAEFTATLKPIEDAWVEKAKAAGMPNAEAVLADFRAEIEAEAQKIAR